MAATARTAMDNLSTMGANMNWLDNHPITAGALYGAALFLMMWGML
jgi:hypothetical protein